jgi:hypothetical protein
MRGPLFTVLPQLRCEGPRAFCQVGFAELICPSGLPITVEKVRGIILFIGGTCMRISGLLVVLLCGLVSICGASDPLRQSSSSQAAAASLSSDWFNASQIARHDFFKLPASDRADRDYRDLDPAQDGDLTCYTIESYLVKRQSPHSDVVEPAGHSTCQRASRYGVKTVLEPGKVPSH